MPPEAKSEEQVAREERERIARKKKKRAAEGKDNQNPPKSKGVGNVPRKAWRLIWMKCVVHTVCLFQSQRRGTSCVMAATPTPRSVYSQHWLDVLCDCGAGLCRVRSASTACARSAVGRSVCRREWAVLVSGTLVS